MNWALTAAAMLAVSGIWQIAAADEKTDMEKEGPPQAAIVGHEVATIANQLGLNPAIAIDFTEVSGEYCFETGLGQGAHMTHYTVDPLSTQEDVIDFVNATSLIEAGVDVTKLPPFPGGLGSMEPNTWYYLAAGELEPHHGVKFDMPLLLRASNIK